jgi:putative cell wall-binding protein/protocatechuate 3,4-dioxygenase beta subunit
MHLRRILASLLVLTLVFGLVIPPASAEDADNTETTSTRYFGNDRYATAVEISKAGWDKGANVIVLARGDVYADALAGVPLAYANDAPILLTTPKSLPKATKDEIVRLEPTVIYILGGIGAVSQDIEDELLAMDIDVRRIDGANRFDTAAKIALELAPDGAGSVFIAFGLNFPDALSAASYAADYGAPILLTTKDKLPAETAKALETLSPNQIFVIGGPAVISDQVLEGLDNAKRISGVDRFATSVALAERFAHKESLIFIATGNNASGGADAITGAALAAKRGTGILLVGNTLPEVVAEFLGKRIEEIIILGGNSAVSAAVAEALENAKYVPGDEVPLPPPPDPVEEPDEQSIFNISFDLPANFKVDETDTVKVTFAPEDVKDLGYDNVRFKIFSDTEGVNFQAVGQDGTELNFNKSGYWGPEEGFTIAGDEEIEIDWTLNFSKRGLYKITFQLVTAETDERVLLEGSETVEVLDDIIRLVKEEVTVPSNKKITDDEKGTQNVSTVSSMTVVNETLDDVQDDAGELFTYIGRVTDGEHGIANATVIVWYKGKYGFGCVTDENGRFEIERPYGNYQLEIRAEGYKPYFQPEITIGSPPGHDRFRNFSFGLMSGEDEYRLTQADTLETYTVRGTVFDGANNPIRNTRISVWSEETEYNAFTRTDSEGKYTLNLPEGRYYFWLSPQEHDGHITFEQIITGRIDNLDWHLPFVGLARVNVHGVLQDDKGNHLAGVYVHAWQQNGYSVSTITEQDGNYSMQLPEGPYNFYIELEGHFPIHAPNCRITADQSKMDWTLETVGEVKTISGCVKDEKGSPIPGISVFAGGIDFTYSASAVTNQEGIYTLQLPCADYVFDVYAPKYFFLPEIKQVEEDSKFDLTLKSVSKLAVVSGTVFNPDGSPAVDAQIEVAGIGNIFWGQAYTKKDGGYSISLAEGTYSFSVQSKEGYMTSGRVTVIDQDCEVDWSLVDYGSLHAVNGTVSSEEGPLPLVFVNAQCPDLDHYCFTESDLQGKFSLELYEGDYIIEYRMDGYYIETSYLTIDGAVDLGEVMLEPLGDCHDVSGTVKDKDGNPLRAEVIFSGQDIGYWKVVRTNSKGEYSATVPEGTYWIYVEAEDYCRKTLRDVIIDQPKTLETIILYEPVTISGQITGPTGDTIPEAEVIAWSYEELEDHRYWEASGITDANGCYELLVTPNTGYIITIDHPTLPFMEITVAVGDEDITENIAYDPACRLEGTVTDGANPIEDVEVVFYQEWDWLGATRTDADGKYYYWVPKDQTIRIDFSHEDYWGEEKEVEVPSGDSMVVDNQVLTGVGDKYRFSGTVSSVDGPLQDVWIYVYHTAENYTVGLYTNYDGAFSFDIPMGEYRIFVYQEPYCEFRDTIAIENSSVIKDIELYLPVTLSGTVTTNGFAQEGVLVKVQQPVGDVWYLVGEEITDENGYYSFQVAPHTTYLVEFYHDIFLWEKQRLL